MEDQGRTSGDVLHYVYEWVDPRDMVIFYVGITVHLYERYKQHMRCDGLNPQKDQRIQEILAAGHLPIMRTIEQVSTLAQALERERYWIQLYLCEEIPLLNIAGTSESASSNGVQRVKKQREPAVQYVINPWDVVDLVVFKRGNRLMTVEHATDGEFQSWVEWNGLHPKKDFPEWSFDHRFVLINHVLAQGGTLRFADGSRMPKQPTNQEFEKVS